jgi:IS5 family transposase
MVTILQFRHNLSDRAAAQALADRISWKYCLGLELEDTGFDYSVLSEFRARLSEGGRSDALLSLMLQRLKAAGLVKAGGRQRTDSTHVIACVRRLNRIESVGEGLRAALEAIAATSPDWIVPLLREGWDERYGRKVETARLLSRKNASAQALADQIGADGQALLAAIDADPAAAWINELPEITVLRTLWEQQYTTTPAGRLRLKDAADLPPAADRVHSPHDPDARYSTKGRGHDDDLEWVGSKVHLSESCDPDLPNLITDVHTTPATDPDVVATTAIQDKLISRGLTPGEHLMDAGYPSAPSITASAQRGITLIAPVIVATGRNAHRDTFGPADFTLDWQAGTATCPAGATSRSMKPDKRGLVTFAFSRRDCRPCPIRSQCTLATPNIPRRITIHPEPVHEARMAAHRSQHSDQWRKTYNIRAGVEGTVSQAVRGPNIRHARYQGLDKTHVQNVITGMALNVTRLGAYLDVKPNTHRRPTRIHQLCVSHGLAAS